jgi:hypothetical protein
MLAKVKQLIDEHGMDYWKKNIKNLDDPYKYVRSYHRHSFILEPRDMKPRKMAKPKVIVNGDYMKIILTGGEQGEPVSLDGINNILIDLRGHLGGNMGHGIEIMQNIYGDTTMFYACNKWYALKDGNLISDELSHELAFKDNIVVLVSERLLHLVKYWL